MPEQEIVVAKIVGEELRVERYALQQRSESSFHCPGGRTSTGGRASTGDRLEEVVRRVRPHLLIWSARDRRGRRLAKALERADDETQWRPGEGRLPGCVEVERWTDLPLSEVLRLTRVVGSEEGARPAEAEREVEARLPAEGEQTIQRPPAPGEGRLPEHAPARWEGEARLPDEARAHSADLPGENWEEVGDRLELVLAARAKRRTDGQTGK